MALLHNTHTPFFSHTCLKDWSRAGNWTCAETEQIKYKVQLRRVSYSDFVLKGSDVEGAPPSPLKSWSGDTVTPPQRANPSGPLVACSISVPEQRAAQPVKCRHRRPEPPTGCRSTHVGRLLDCFVFKALRSGSESGAASIQFTFLVVAPFLTFC